MSSFSPKLPVKERQFFDSVSMSALRSKADLPLSWKAVITHVSKRPTAAAQDSLATEGSTMAILVRAKIGLEITFG